MKLVVDANVVLALVVPTPYSQAAATKYERWIEAEAELVAPIIWSYEAVSVVRKLASLGHLEDEAAAATVSRLLTIGPLAVHPTEFLHLKALEWARRLRQHVAYDAAYLALAEHLETELWTADRKLARNARSLGVEWVRDIAGAERKDFVNGAESGS